MNKCLQTQHIKINMNWSRKCMHACMYLRKVLFLLIRFVFRIACNVICSIHFHAVHIHIKPTCRQYNLLCSCHYMCIVEENKCQRQSYSTYNQTTTTLTKSYKSVLIDAINEYYISLWNIFAILWNSVYRTSWFRQG